MYAVLGWEVYGDLLHSNKKKSTSFVKKLEQLINVYDSDNPSVSQDSQSRVGQIKMSQGSFLIWNYLSP